jgi:hypothetical protein
MTNDKLKAITELFANEAFMNKLSSVSEEKDIILLAKKYGVEITEQELDELFTPALETKKWAKEVADCAQRLEELLKEPEKQAEFAELNSEEKFMEFCKANNVNASEKFLPMLYCVAFNNKDTMELTEEELDSVAGGISLWGIFKFGVGLIPLVGTLAQTFLDLADGSLRGGANIGARFALSAISAMFGAVGSIAEAGIFDIAGGWIANGFSAVAGKLTIWTGTTVVSSGTGMDVDHSVGL